MKMGGAGKTMRRSFQSGKSERGYANATQNACAVSSGCSTETSLTVPAKPIPATILDRKSTRLNSSHSQTSYAVFCLKKKNNDVELARYVMEAVRLSNWLFGAVVPFTDVQRRCRIRCRVLLPEHDRVVSTIRVSSTRV